MKSGSTSYQQSTGRVPGARWENILTAGFQFKNIKRLHRCVQYKHDCFRSLELKRKTNTKWPRYFEGIDLFRKCTPIYNDPFACLCQTSKFHHQASFWSWKVAKLCVNEFPNQNSWKEYSRPKRANAKSFAYKRGSVVWYFSQHLVEFGKEVRHLPAGFYLGYLGGRISLPPKCLTSTPPRPPPKKSIVIITVDISNYIGKIS